MQYVAFLRGINVGGNNLINMAELKTAFEAEGFVHVRTYINSGNVLFESRIKISQKLEEQIETLITKTFMHHIAVLVVSHDQLKNVLSAVPDEWHTKTDIRCYISFLMHPLTIEEAVKEMVINETVDDLKVGQNVLYMTTLLSGLTKSRFNQMIGKKFYQQITIRSYGTIQKILTLLEAK